MSPVGTAAAVRGEFATRTDVIMICAPPRYIDIDPSTHTHLLTQMHFPITFVVWVFFLIPVNMNVSPVGIAAVRGEFATRTGVIIIIIIIVIIICTLPYIHIDPSTHTHTLYRKCIFPTAFVVWVSFFTSL